MVIRLTKNYKKPSGKMIPKDTIIEVVEGHPYKDFEVVMKDGNLDSPKNELASEELKTKEALRGQKEHLNKTNKIDK